MALRDRLRECADQGGAVTLTRLDCRRLLVLLGALPVSTVQIRETAHEGFQVDDRGAGGRCLRCGWMAIRGAGETGTALAGRMLAHAGRHQERIGR